MCSYKEVLETDVVLNLYNISVPRIACKTCTDSIYPLSLCIQGSRGESLHNLLHSVLHALANEGAPQETVR